MSCEDLCSFLVSPLSLTRSAIARVFSCVLACSGYTPASALKESVAFRTLAFLGVHPSALDSVSLHRFGAVHQPSLRSQRTMMTYANSLPRREAGSLTNRTVTVRTIADFKHPRTDGTALLLPTTTELLVIDLIA